MAKTHTPVRSFGEDINPNHRRFYTPFPPDNLVATGSYQVAVFETLKDRLHMFVSRDEGVNFYQQLRKQHNLKHVKRQLLFYRIVDGLWTRWPIENPGAMADF